MPNRFISRYMVDLPSPSCLAASVGGVLASMSLMAALIFFASRGCRPGRLPLALAAATPSFVRSEISRRSKWAMAPNTWKISSPAAEDVSIFSSKQSKAICCKPTMDEMVNAPCLLCLHPHQQIVLKQCMNLYGLLYSI